MRIKKQREVQDKMEDRELVRRSYKNKTEAQVQKQKQKRASKTSPKCEIEERVGQEGEWEEAEGEALFKEENGQKKR